MKEWLLDVEWSWFNRRCFSSLAISIPVSLVIGWLGFVSKIVSDICVIPVDELRSCNVEFIRFFVLQC